MKCVMMNKKPTEPGRYLYMMPGWTHAKEVEVRLASTLLLVYFIEEYPIWVENTDQDALWERMEN